jgi:hypothetical protein
MVTSSTAVNNDTSNATNQRAAIIAHAWRSSRRVRLLRHSSAASNWLRCIRSANGGNSSRQMLRSYGTPQLFVGYKRQ